MQNSVLTNRIASLNLSQVSSVVFPSKTGTLGPELQVSMVLRPHLSFCACITAWLAPDLRVPMGPSPHLWFCAFKTATLAPQLQGSIFPLHHQHQNNKSVLVPALIGGFCMQKSDFRTIITSLYGSQTSPVDLCMKTACLPQEFLVFTGPRPRLGICECKTACLAPEWQVCMGSSPHLWFCALKRATLVPDLQVSLGPTTHLWIFTNIAACLAQEYQVYMGCSPHLWFMHAKRRLEDKNYKSAWFPDLICGFVQTKQLV